MFHFIHQWSKWEDMKVVSIYENDYYKLPVKQHLVQIKTCKICNKKKTRRRKI